MPTFNALSFERRTLSKLKEYIASGHLKSKPNGRQGQAYNFKFVKQFSRDPEVKAWVVWNADSKCEL